MEHERNTQYDHQHGRESQEKAADQQVEVKDRGLLDTLLGRNKSEEDQVKKQEEALVTGIDNVKVSERQKHEVNKDEHHGVGEKKKKKSLLAKLHRTGSSTSSSSDDEEEEVIDDNGEVVKRKKKKKGLKEKIKEKLAGHKDDHGVEEGEHKPYPPAPPVPTHVVHHQEAEEHKQPYVPTPAPAHTYVHQQEPASVETTHAYKEHDDDHHHKTSSSYIPAPVVVQNQKVEETTPEKGLLDKIKEKLPGGHKKPEVDAAAPPLTATEDVSSPDGKEKKQGLLGKIMDKIPGYNKSPTEEEHKPAAATGGEHKKTSS